jgi:hypothetical protein
MITLNRSTVFNAGKNLTYTSFKLWIFLTQFEKSFKLHRNTVMNEIGISKNSFTSAIRELKLKGYLVEHDDKSYSFFENPSVHAAYDNIVNMNKTN